MKEIESFTATALVLNSERLIHWSTIGGLTIDGLTRADAVAVMRLVEAVSVRAREQADGTPAAVPDKASSRLSPDSASQAKNLTTKNESREEELARCIREAGSHVRRQQSSGKHEQDRIDATHWLDKYSSLHKLPTSTESASPVSTEPAVVAEPVLVAEAPAESAKKPSRVEVAPLEVAPLEAGKKSAPKKSAPKKSAPKKSAPKGQSPRPPWATPVIGSSHEGLTVRAVTPTAMGGAKVLLDDGTTIVYDDKGVELFRSTKRSATKDTTSSRETSATRIVPKTYDAPTPPSCPATGDSSEPAVAPGETPPSTITPPEEVMKTRMTRDVLKWVMDQGVTERDQIIAECERLKTAGAVAFSTCPDVHQRATTVLTAMGVA